MKIAKLLGALVAGGALLATSVQAVPITGGVSMAGGYTVVGSLASGPVSFSSFNNVIVTSGSGTYLGIPAGTAVPTYNSFSAQPSSAPVTPLWSFTYLGVLYSFDLNSMVITSRGTDINGNPFLNLSGNGTLHVTGLTDTAGSWIFTANAASATFSFSSSNGALPDGGTTAVLLGSALAMLGMARRYFAKA